MSEICPVCLKDEKGAPHLCENCGKYICEDCFRAVEGLCENCYEQ